MKKHIPYKSLKNREPDFVVTYSFIKKQPDYTQKLYQGMRIDFMYDDWKEGDPVYMIWPDFLDDSGEVILDGDEIIPDTGKANM